MLVPLLPRFIEDELGAGELGIGLSVAMFALAAILVRPIIARLIEAHGRRIVMIGGALIAALGGAAHDHRRLPRAAARHAWTGRHR